jgi:hypothetical protein
MFSEVRCFAQNMEKDTSRQRSAWQGPEIIGDHRSAPGVLYAGPDDHWEGDKRDRRPGLGTTILSPNGWRCITQHFVLCGTYSSPGQEYSVVVTCHVTVAKEGEPATCPPPDLGAATRPTTCHQAGSSERRSCVVGEERRTDSSHLRRPGDWPGYRGDHAG